MKYYIHHLSEDLQVFLWRYENRTIFHTGQPTIRAEKYYTRPCNPFSFAYRYYYILGK